MLETDYPNFEVLFVDNGSKDASIDFVTKTFHSPLLRIIQNEINLGYAEGNNRGIKNSEGEYIALLNNDVTVEPGWLKELINAMEQSNVGAAQSKLLQMDAPSLIDCAGGLLDFYGYHVERGRGKNANLYNQQEEIFYAKGASILLKPEALEKTGLLDPRIFLYFDEVDLCWRIWLNGYKVAYVPRRLFFMLQGRQCLEHR